MKEITRNSMLEQTFKAVTSIAIMFNLAITCDDANRTKKRLYNQNKCDKKGYHGYLITPYLCR